jgi:hypothetical protein
VPLSPDGIPIPPATTTTFAAPDPLPSPQDQARSFYVQFLQFHFSYVHISGRTREL